MTNQTQPTDTIQLTREEQLELENANLKINLAEIQLSYAKSLHQAVIQKIGRDHNLKEGNFIFNAEAGVIQRAPQLLPPAQDPEEPEKQTG
ncbi:MAG: hypothetical protein KAJ19_12535 [Gammaproteobacteria bacterium]|nr:hypothetical protein [Gammaproteobacteria bacterium]